MGTVSDRSQQITNSAIYLLPLVVGNLVPIVTLPIFTYLLTPEDFGVLALSSSYATVVSGLAGAGLSIGYERNFFEHEDSMRRTRLLYSAMAFTACTFLVSILVTFVFRAPISLWLTGQAGHESVLVWSLALTAVVSVKAFYMTLLRNTEQAGAYSTYMIVERLLTAVFSLVLVWGLQVGVIGMAIGPFASGAVLLVVIGWRLLPSNPVGFDGRLLKDALRIGYPLMPRVLFGVIGNNVDKYLIGQVASLGGVGLYSIGQRVANIAFTYMTALQNVFGPQVYKRMFSGDVDSGHLIGRYLTPFAYASTVMSFLIGVFSEEILTVLAPVSYRGAIPIVSVLVLYFGILFFGKMPQITYARKTYLISVIAAASTAVNVACGAAGIFLFGTIGAAWGTLTAGVIMTTVTFLVGQRCFRIHWEARPMVAIFGLLFGSIFLTIGLRALGVPYPVLLGAKVAALAAFVWLGARLGILSRENLQLVRDLVLRRTVPSTAPPAGTT